MRCAAACFLTVVAGLSESTSAIVLYQADFAAFSEGALVGQQGWARRGGSTSNPIRVLEGQVFLPFRAGGFADDESAIHAFPARAAGSVYLAAELIVGDAAAVPGSTYGSAWFIALDSTDPQNLAYLRVCTRAGNAPDTFQLGLRANGQYENQVQFGPDLPLRQPLRVIAGWDFAAGAQNDSGRLWVNPVSRYRTENNLYALAPQVHPTGDPPGLDGVGIDQFTAFNLPQTGVSIARMIVADNFTEAAAFLGFPDCDPDFNCDGNADQDDIACIINIVAGNPGCECQDYDFNRDGNSDQDDIVALIGAIAGQGCP